MSSSSSGQASASSPLKNNRKMVVVLGTDDGESFEVEPSIATKESAIINNLLDSDCGDSTIVPLPNIMAPVLARVLEFWNQRIDRG